jgi:hypothetical protein
MSSAGASGNVRSATVGQGKSRVVDKDADIIEGKKKKKEQKTYFTLE